MTAAPGAGREAIFETDLHGYLDGELPARRRVEVEYYLATHPDHAARFAEFSIQTLSLHRLYGDGHPANPRIEALTADLDRALRRRRRMRRLLQLAAAALVLAAGTGIGSGLHGLFQAGAGEDHFLVLTRQSAGANAPSSGEPLLPQYIGGSESPSNASSADASDENKIDQAAPAHGASGAKGGDATEQPTVAPVPVVGTPRKT
jgi:hypothetical protein